ncbi:hypothetical protein PR048_024493 [Dryococelus australis]|uniref:Mutator-like transposase domain-containing protein n=1 Tax=Dryococelus australis TaxID=614101 RepID=A0ABQ9GNP7_9NEOP|nr:hypothetical protein PR048_024493 [Dryococelus australis]
MANVLPGRGIVDMTYLFTQIQNEKHHGGTDCSFMDMDFWMDFTVHGFLNAECYIVSEIMSENRENKDTYMPINETAVHSILASGGGYSQLREFSAGVDMHCMSKKTFLKHMKKVSGAIDDAALQSMIDAAEEEKALAIRDGNVYSDEVPMCSVVADGAWCKRISSTKFIVILYLSFLLPGIHCWFYDRKGVRNRYCSICASCQNTKQTPPSHTCFLDWQKSATSMEADIIADGFLQSVKLLSLKFNKLIGEILTVGKMVDYTDFVLMLTGDGDSSVHRKLLETMPYGPNLIVEKVECENHVLRNYCHKLTDLTKNTKFPVTSRNLLKQQIPAAGNEPLNTRICMLKADVESSPLHIFGDHEHCDVYLCNGNKEREINHVPELKSCGSLQEIMKIICGSVSRHVSSLRADQNNNYRTQICCRKRINYALIGQYKTRCSAAISFNIVGEYMRVIHKTMMGKNSQGESTREKKLYATDDHYGLIQTEQDDPSSTKKKRKKKNSRWPRADYRRERSATENDCVAIKLSPVEYREEEVTNCLEFWQRQPHHANSILYGNLSTTGTQYGIANEPVAKRKMAEEHGIVAIECGLLVDSEYPVLGTTRIHSHGLVDEDAIVKVKCPLSADKYGSPKEAVGNGQMSYYAIVNGKPLLRRESNYYNQVQGQLHINGIKYCCNLVYISRWMTHEVIEKDDESWSDRMAQSLCRFYKECLFEELVNPKFSKRFVKADIKDPIYITTAQKKDNSPKKSQISSKKEA